jgi:archaellum component FlaC
LEQITEKDAIIDDLRTSLETIKNEAVEEVKNLKESKEQCSQLELEIKRLQELLAIETQEKNTWKEKHDHLYADWENLTCLIKAEHEQTKARIDR